MILGRDILMEVGIDILFSKQLISSPQFNAEIPMKPILATPSTHCHVEEQLNVENEAQRLAKVLEAKYKPANLEEICASTGNITEEQKSRLLALLKQYKELFNGLVGTWKGPPYKIQLKQGVTPYHAKPYPVPKAHELTLKTEIARLCKIGILKKVNQSE